MVDSKYAPGFPDVCSKAVLNSVALCSNNKGMIPSCGNLMVSKMWNGYQWQKGRKSYFMKRDEVDCHLSFLIIALVELNYHTKSRHMYKTVKIKIQEGRSKMAGK